VWQTPVRRFYSRCAPSRFCNQHIFAIGACCQHRLIYPSTCKCLRASRIMEVFQRMFIGSIHPEKLGIVFENFEVLRCTVIPG
jgi:hypothetical protein